MTLMKEVLIISIPILLVIGALYLFGKSILNQRFGANSQSVQKDASEITIPLRIQAYERMALFLERISPNNLLLRLYDRAQFVGDFQQLLLKEIREEYYHNLAQQIYVSSDLWEEITKAMNEVMALINTSAGELQKDDAAINLSKRIFDKVINEDKNLTQGALKLLKQEVALLF